MKLKLIRCWFDCVPLRLMPSSQLILTTYRMPPKILWMSLLLLIFRRKLKIYEYLLMDQFRNDRKCEYNYQVMSRQQQDQQMSGSKQLIEVNLWLLPSKQQLFLQLNLKLPWLPIMLIMLVDNSYILMSQALQFQLPKYQMNFQFLLCFILPILPTIECSKLMMLNMPY